MRADAGRGAVDSLRLQLATACIPHIYASVGEIESARAAYGANLDALLDESVNASGVRGRALACRRFRFPEFLEAGRGRRLGLAELLRRGFSCP